MRPRATVRDDVGRCESRLSRLPALIGGFAVGLTLVFWAWTFLVLELHERVPGAALVVGTLAVGFVGLGACWALVRGLVRPRLERAREQLGRLAEDGEPALRRGPEGVAVGFALEPPLAALLAVIGRLTRTALDDEQRRYVELCSRSARGLQALAGESLDLSRLEAERLASDGTDLRQLLAAQLELLSVWGQARQLDIVFRVGPEVPQRLALAPGRVAQLVTDAIGQAIALSEAGEMFVDVTRPSDAELGPLRLLVHAPGPGLFERGQPALSTLSVSRALVTALGGELGVERDEPHGSRLWLTLSAAALAPAPSEVPPEGADGRRVLVVDRGSRQREVLCEQAQRWGMKAEQAPDLEVARACLRNAAARDEPFHVVAIDARLVPSGEEDTFAQRLRFTGGAELSVVFLVTEPPAPPLRDCAASWLEKPVRPRDFLERVLARAPAVRAASEPPTALPQPPAPSAAVSQRTGRSASVSPAVLVVDDNEINRIVTREMLERLGYECELVASGREALERFSARRFDAVLMDCEMPEMDGYETTEGLRRLATPFQGPVIALTAHASSEDAARARSAGMDDFLTKPVTPGALDATLQRCLAARVSPPSRPSAPGPLASACAASTGDVVAGEPAVLRPQKRSRRLLEVFLRNVPGQVEAIDRAWVAGDLAEARAQAHKLKGSAAALGAEALSRVCGAIQSSIDRGAPEDAPVALLRGDAERALAAVQAELGPS